MIRDPGGAWQPQKAPVDFAERVVDAVVRERARTAATRGPVSLRRGAVLLVAAASLLLVGSAWAAWRARRVEPSPAAAIAAPVVTALPVTPTVTVVPASAADAAPVVPAPLVVPPRPKVAAPARPSAAPSASASASRKVIVPRCFCHDIACDCGPETP
jgi:hypothetical protein